MSAPGLYDEGEHVKEVYAYFGLAFYLSGVFETGLAIALLQGEFLLGWKNKLKREGKGSFSRNVYEAEFDAFMKRQHDQTLGNLIKRFEAMRPLPGELKQAISNAKATRDMLAHHYFRERAVEFSTRAGRDFMLSELRVMQEAFTDVDAEVQKFIAPIRQEIGIRDEVLKRFMDEHIRKAHEGAVTRKDFHHPGAGQGPLTPRLD